MISEQFQVSRPAALQWLADCGGSGQSCMQGPCSARSELKYFLKLFIKYFQGGRRQHPGRHLQWPPPSPRDVPRSAGAPARDSLPPLPQSGRGEGGHRQHGSGADIMAVSLWRCLKIFHHHEALHQCIDSNAWISLTRWEQSGATVACPGGRKAVRRVRTTSGGSRSSGRA